MRSIRPDLAVITGLAALTVALSAQQRPVPAQNPSDVKALVFELANSMGMLRGLRQEDWIATLEQWAKGTMIVAGRRFELPDHRTSINYTVPGMRVDFHRQPQGEQPQRQIEVVAGAAAWNEADRGRNATPAPDKVKERLVYLWTTPMGIVKAATAAGPGATMKAVGGETMLSFQLPPPANDVTAAVTVRKDAALLARPNEDALPNLVGTYIIRVETSGPVVSETTYAEYGDWNWDDYKADVMLPRRTTRKHGDTVLELMTVNTNTYNPYVIMPVPDNVTQRRP
jgi:hypothetical protein